MEVILTGIITALMWSFLDFSYDIRNGLYSSSGNTNTMFIYQINAYLGYCGSACKYKYYMPMY